MEMLPNTTNTVLQPTLLQRLTTRLHHLVFTFRAMLSAEAIIHHVVALLLCGGALLILQHPDLLPAMGKYHGWFNNALLCLGAWQIILSARRSLLLPLATLAIAGTGLALLAHHLGQPWLSPSFLKDLMLLGLIGLAVSIFNVR